MLACTNRLKHSIVSQSQSPTFYPHRILRLVKKLPTISPLKTDTTPRSLDHPTQPERRHELFETFKE